MVAYFSSKLSKQIKAVFTVALLVFCMLGTHWIGLSHSISHGISQSQTLESKAVHQVDSSLSHSSDACHLLDALSLAGFILTTGAVLHSLLSESQNVSVTVDTFTSILEIASYQSRAPPFFII